VLHLRGAAVRDPVFSVARIMSAPRLKFQVWSEKFGRWKTVYVLVTMLHENLIHMKAHGLKVRVGSECR
jgi:hypothetical protein